MERNRHTRTDGAERRDLTQTPVRDVVVVIPTFNKGDMLPPLLTALAEQTLDPDRFEVW